MSERHRFKQLKQQEGEGVTAFAGRLLVAADKCKFPATDVDTIENCQLCDQLIFGLRLNEIRRELLKESQLTLAKAIVDSVAMESSLANSKMYKPFASSVPSFANRVTPTDKPKDQACPQRSNLCKYCGK